jgi:hypothetical protein
MTSRTTSEKLAIFRGLFTGLPEVYGTYDLSTGKVRQVKEPVTDQVLLAHLKGKQPYGVYLLMGDTIRALAVDFDSDELSYPLAFKDGAKRYKMFTYVERSKAKGYHVWMFFEEEGVPARKARLVVKSILARMGKLDTEIFPKQDALDEHTQYGNFINAPLFGALVPKGRTVFVDPAKPAQPYPDQWELLAGVQRIEEFRLDAVIESCSLDPQDSTDGVAPPAKSQNSAQGLAQSFGLPPCAQRMLAEGVSDQQRMSCFRLAVHLKLAGIPRDLAVPMLQAWAPKNRPQNGKRIITDAEIWERARDAYEKEYRSCGCEDSAVRPYCDERCPLHTVHKSVPPREQIATASPGQEVSEDDSNTGDCPSIGEQSRQ